MRKNIQAKKPDTEKRESERQNHIRATEDNEISEELPEIMLPDIFSEINQIYWESLKSVPYPGSPGRCVYSLHLIICCVISCFIGRNKYIGVLFPGKRMNIGAGKKKPGALPTRKAVYTFLGYLLNSDTLITFWNNSDTDGQDSAYL